MRVTVERAGGALETYVKGAAEVVLRYSSLDDEARRIWTERAETGAKRGCKVLGLAKGDPNAPRGLEFLGLVSLWDAPRTEALAAVRAAEAAGIRV